jgi:CubicO group peptidase (beta-lactamase class C family)
MLLEPIGTPRATFRPDAELRRSIPTLYSRTGGGFREYESPAGASAFPRPGGGLYATLEDVATFFLLHRNRGTVKDKTLVPAGMLDEMYAAQPKTPGEGYGLGFNTLRRGPDGRPRRIRHIGASGTLAFLDFDADVIAVLFTQVPDNQDTRFRERVAREVSSLFIE